MELSLDMVLTFFARIIVIFTALPFHEYAHAFIANKLGDHTARNMGRLTLNPLSHIDPIGAIAIFLVGFGWAKPVPINARNFKNPKVGMAVSAVAGPLSNLLMAYIASIVCKVIALTYDGSTMMYFLSIIFSTVATVNVSLAIFNLIPVPPLDGSRVLLLFLPERAYFGLMRYERYLPIFLILLLRIPQVSTVFGLVALRVSSFLYSGTGFLDVIFRIFLGG